MSRVGRSLPDIAVKTIYMELNLDDTCFEFTPAVYSQILITGFIFHVYFMGNLLSMVPSYLLCIFMATNAELENCMHVCYHDHEVCHHFPPLLPLKYSNKPSRNY